MSPLTKHVIGLSLLIIQYLHPYINTLALLPAEATTESHDDFCSQYSAVTKQIMLKAIELERFSLNYRLEGCRQSVFRRLLYVGTQEAAASCVLGFEVTTAKQLNTAKSHPLQVSTDTLQKAIIAAEVGSILTASASCFEITANIFKAIKNRQKGFNSTSATEFVSTRMKDLDQLLTKRALLVENNSANPEYNRAILEGRILSELRQAFLSEYSSFHADINAYTAYTNTFYLLNVATGAVGATAAGIAYKAIKEPKLNGTANILFTVTGGLATVSPILSTLAGKIARKYSFDAVLHKTPINDNANFSELESNRKLLEQLSLNGPSLMPSLPATERLAIYAQSGSLFKKQIANETTISHRLGQVAIESSIFGPFIGGCLLTQGILGTVGYYKYPMRPRKQFDYLYNGAVVGTVGAGIAVVGTAAATLTALAYENHLRKHKQLPVQLIRERLAHLDQLENSINHL